MFISSQIDQFLLSCFKIHPDIRLLSLDMGYKHIGLAYSATSKIAVPLPSISGETKLWIAALNSVIKEKNPNGLILGWPLNDDETLTKG
jgi:RNase H-fold protein (predicted Holliday junction resolvase)